MSSIKKSKNINKNKKTNTSKKKITISKEKNSTSKKEISKKTTQKINSTVKKDIKNTPKNKKSSTNKKKYVIVIVLLLLIMSLSGIAYAYFNYGMTGEGNSIGVGKIYMHYNTSQNISLQSAVPRSNLDPDTYIQFTIDGLNEYLESPIWYAIDLLYGDPPSGKTEANRIRDDLLRFTLVKQVDGGEEQVVVNAKDYESINNLRMYVENIPAGTLDEKVHTYKLYMWISDEIKVGNGNDVDYDLDEWSDLFANIKVRVVGDFLPKVSSSSVRVNFNANGGSVDVAYTYYDKGSTYGSLPTPEREDYSFDGWFYNNSLVTDSDTVPGNVDVINLEAEWTEIPGVAKIGNTYYGTLAAAIAAVPTTNTEQTIIVLKNINECVTVAKNKTMIINLRGNTIGSSCNDTIFINNGTMTILNGTVNGGNIGNAVINNNAGAKVVVGNGGRVVATGTRGAIYSQNATVEIQEGAYLSAAPTGTAGGRQLPRATINSFGGGTVLITGGTIIGVNQEAVAVENSNLTIGVKDGTVNRTSPVIQGKTNGVSVLASTVFKFYDGIIKGRTSGINNTTLIDEKETGCGLVTSSETIDGQTYVTHRIGLGITVQFDPKDGSIDVADASRTIEAGDRVGTLPTATYEGHRFLGWFTDRDNGVQITAETIVSQNTTYYAHWEEIIVAAINGVEYNTVQSALDDIPTNNTPVTVTITDDLTENISIKANQNVILDIQDNTIDNNGDVAVITNNGTVEIVSGTVTSDAPKNAAINNNAGGRIIINGGSIVTTADRGSIYNNGGIVEIRGNSYLSSTATGRATTTTLDRATINNFNGGTVIVTGGTIVGVNQQAISNENATLTIGTKNGSINTTTPTIIGKNYGVVNTGTFNWYDGTIKGQTGAISGTVTERETNSQEAPGTETIDGFTYYTKHLILTP